MSYLEEIILSRDGDFNLLVNDRDNHDASLLLDLLESMDLVQHVIGATHEKGQTLALVITRETDSALLGSPMTGQFISDHPVVNCSFNSIKPSLFKKSIINRKIKDIDITVFKENLIFSALMQGSTVNSHC